MLALSIAFLVLYGASMLALFLLLRPKASGQDAALQARLEGASAQLDAVKGELSSLRASSEGTGRSLARKEEEVRALSAQLDASKAESLAAKAESSASYQRLQEESARLSASQEGLKLSRAALEEVKADASKLKTALAAESETRLALASEASRLKAELDAASKRLDGQASEMKRLQEEASAKFEALASKLLEEKGERLSKLQAERLSEILSPLKEKLGEFRKRVEEVYEKESKDRTALQEQVRQMAEMNRKVSEDANRLAEALKGDSKTMGDWGEMLLDQILEGSGLQEGQEYFTQESVRDGDGKLLRPDVLIKLPQGKSIVVDSKVSIAAYVESCGAATEEEREAALLRHVRSVRAHVDELAAKDYQAHVGGALDFVVMFVPNEPAYNLAMRRDPALWQYAYGRKIVLASPTNLFAILKIASELWRKDKEARNYLEIAERGASIYDKLAVFLDYMEDVGKGLDDARRVYEKAVNNLRGHGGLVGQAERMRKLGLKTKRQLAESWREGDDSETPSSGKLESAEAPGDGTQAELPL